MDDAWATVEHLADDRSSGASEIARKAAAALAELPNERVIPAVELLLRAHPSMAPLWRLPSLGRPDRAASARLLDWLMQGDLEGANALSRRVFGQRLLTISYSSSIIDLTRRGNVRGVACMWSDPGGEGVRTADAMSAWTNSTVIDDEDALRDVPADAVVVGADALTPSSVVNKVKTRALAEAARAKRIPVYALAGAFKFVGDEIPVRPPFEATPLQLFSAIAGPEGLWDPEEAGSYARRWRIDPELRPLFDELTS
jgi:translation initiation factor 2B subunit (eIF-2B alpha/beta/delta family)